MKRKVTIFISFILGLVFIAIWLHIVDLKEVFNTFRTVKIILIFPLIIIFVLIYFLRSLRWKIILSPVEQITTIDSFKLCMTNYLINFLVPIHAGEIAKSLLLKKLKGTPLSKSLLTVYLDKATDLLPIFFLLSVTPFLDPRINSIIYLISGILLAVFSILIISLISLGSIKKTALDLIEKIFFFLPIKFKAKLKSFYLLFVESLSVMPRLSNRLFEICGLTLFALVLHCLLLWLFFYSFGINLPLITVFVGYLLLNASLILPAPPGFSGSLELIILFIFSYLYNYDKNVVSAVAASSHVFTAILFGILGILSMTLIGTSLSKLLKVEAEDKIEELQLSN